jgi:hypothetical protein
VVGAIAPKLEQAETERAMRKPTESLDAYDYILRGMAQFHLFTRDSLLEARQLFHRVTELDPTYAAAYGFGAWCVTTRQFPGQERQRSRSPIGRRRRVRRRSPVLCRVGSWKRGLRWHDYVRSILICG